MRPIKLWCFEPAYPSGPGHRRVPEPVTPSVGSTQSRLLSCSMSSPVASAGEYSWTSSGPVALVWTCVRRRWSPAAVACKAMATSARRSGRVARVSVLRNPWHPAMAIEVQPSLARTGSGYRTRGSQRICKENAGIEPLELPPVAKVSGPMSDMSRRNRSGSRNETIWGELAHVCGRIHPHWFRKNDFVSALKYRRRLLRILQNIPDDDLAIIRQEG